MVSQKHAAHAAVCGSRAMWPCLAFIGVLSIGAQYLPSRFMRSDDVQLSIAPARVPSLFQTFYVTGTCAREILHPATASLFDILRSVPPDALQSVYASSNFSQFNVSKRPLRLVSLENQKKLIAFVSQEVCRSGTSPLCDKIGMQPFIVPEGIHAMSGGGKGYVTGGLYNADMVLKAVMLAEPSLILSKFMDGASVLDWGGSSGRSMSMMKAAFPQCHAHVADPIRNSISWVNSNLSRMEVSGYASPINPPTSYSSGKFKLIFAISIWSHYNFGSVAIPWLVEMRRIIHYDGFLVITTHGWPAAYSWLTNDSFGTASKIDDGMNSSGHFYVASFPDNVDWDPDTKNPDWGMSWVDPEWLSRQIHEHWRVVLFLPARNGCLQDVLVLRPSS